MGEKTLVVLSSFFQISHHSAVDFLLIRVQYWMHQGISPHFSSIFSEVMHVRAAHGKFPQTDGKLVQNLCKTWRRKKAGWKHIYLFFFLPPQKHHGNCFANTVPEGLSMAIRHGTGTMKTSYTGLVIRGKVLRDHNTDCNLGWITSMWKITPPVGQRTLFPVVHIYTGLPMLIPSPEGFLRINLQLLMELVACFSTSIWILLIKFASIPMKTVRLGILLFIQI